MTGPWAVIKRHLRSNSMALYVAYGLVVLGFCFGQWRQETTIRSILSERTERVESVCAVAEGIVNTFIAVTPPSKTPDEHAKRQGQIDFIEHDLEARSGKLHCDLHLLPAP